MRILILAVGSEGDVRPFSALGKGLADAGYDVGLFSPETFRGLVASAGLDFSPASVNPMEILTGETGRAWLSSQNDPLRFMTSVLRLVREVLDTLNDEALEACRGYDALIYSLPLSVWAQCVAEILGIPAIPAALYPLHPTRDFPSIMIPKLPLRGGAVNWLSQRTVVQVFWEIVKSGQRHWRKSQPDLPPFSLGYPLSRWRNRRVPVLYGYSPSVVPTPGDWEPGCTVCGYWFTEPQTWTPPKDLVDFLDAGPRPVYVGFGSMLSADPSATTEIVLDALRRTGQRAVLATGWGGLLAEGLPGNVFTLKHAPHDWLFPRMSAAVFHGSAGTTAAALRAGIPSVVVPFFADQYFWGHRLRALGVAPRLLDQKRLTAEGLARAMLWATGNPGARSRASVLAGRIAAERGIGNAVSAVDAYLR